MEKKKIGIIGGGCAGTTLAWQLSAYNDVSLFESSDKLGGHIYTHKLNIDGEEIAIDMGVDHINEKLCPNIFSVLKHFNINTFVAPLSISVSFGDGHKNSDKWSNATMSGNLKEELWQEFNRFHEDMISIATNFDLKYMKTTISDFLKSNNYSDKFAQKALIPILTSYYGCRAPSLDYSIFYTAVSFDMNLLSFFSPGYWRKAEGGMISYIEKMHECIKNNTHLNAVVSKVRKVNNKVEVLLKNGKNHEFDEVVFATHADVALQCLETPSDAHVEILKNFGHVPIHSIGHFDDTVDQSATEREYFSFYSNNKQEYGSLSRISNHLYPYMHVKKPMIVTFDPIKEIDKNKIFHEKKWKLQTLRPTDGASRARIREIQGVDNMWFCGTDTSITGHEGAMVSAFVLAEKLGVPYIFKDNKMAQQQFNVVKFVMGI